MVEQIVTSKTGDTDLGLEQKHLSSAPLRLHIFASGSKGNAALIQSDTTNILIDCGISYKLLCERMAEVDCTAANIDALIISHEHADHVAGLKVFLNHYQGPLFATKGTMQGKSYLQQLPYQAVESGQILLFKGIQISFFATSHDVNSPVMMSFKTQTDHIGFCTDTGFLSDEAKAALKGARILALEANHDLHMLSTSVYPSYLKERIAGSKGHLSNLQTAEALQELIGEKTEQIIAMHLSEQNNLPSVCIKTLAEALGASYSNEAKTRAEKGRLKLCCAAQYKRLSFS